MTKQQRRILSMTFSIAVLLGFIVWRVVRVGDEMRAKLADIEAEQPPPVVPKIPATTPADLLQSMENLLRGIAQATDTLEENHLKRREAKAKGMPFPDELDATSRLLKAKSLEQLTSLEHLLEENLQRKWSDHTVDKLLSYKKQAAGLRDVLHRTDFDPEPKK